MDDDLAEMQAMRKSAIYRKSDAGRRSTVVSSLNVETKQTPLPPKSIPEKSKRDDATSFYAAVNEEEVMRQMMGFSGFGMSKAPEKINMYEKKMEEAKRKTKDNDDMDEGISTKNKADIDNDTDSDDDIIGPMPLVDQSVTVESKTDTVEQSEEEDDREEENKEDFIKV